MGKTDQSTTIPQPIAKLYETIEELRADYELCQERNRERLDREAVQKQKTAEHRSVSLLESIYRSLYRQVMVSCGLGETIRLHLPHNSLQLGTPIDATVVTELAQTRSGLQIMSDPDDADYLLVKLTAAAKRCDDRIDQDDRRTGANTFDFPMLFDENVQRGQLWQKRYRVIAYRLLSLVGKELESLPTRIFGVAEHATITLSLRSSKHIADEFQIATRSFQYTALTQAQLNILTDFINANLSHCQVYLSHQTTKKEFMLQHDVSIELMNQPDKVISDEPFSFSFAAFCDTYNQVTPELQTIFNRITSRLQLFDLHRQVYQLQPQRILLFEDDAYNNPYSLVRLIHQHLMQDTVHHQHLVEAIRTAFPDVRILSIRTCLEQDPVLRNFRPAFVCRYDCIQPESQFFQAQLEVEERIRDIKLNRIDEVALQLAQNLLNQVNRCGVEKFFPGSKYDAPQALRTEYCEITLGDDEVHLSLVEDSDFLYYVEQSVASQTKGFLTVNFTDQTFRLHFLSRDS